uniref:ABC transporter permease n=1 Tax=Gordonia sp. B7-2 TaxID=3420932 RepID=UPI003D8B0B3C
MMTDTVARSDLGTAAWPSTSARTSLITEAWVLTLRQLTVWVRDKTTLFQCIVVPVISMVMFKVVLGDTIGQATGQDSAYGTVPLVILLSAMYGALGAGVRLNVEAGGGLLARLYVMPIHRTADLAGRIAAELLRILLTTILLIGTGYLIGFRLPGLPALIGMTGVALLYGAAFSVMVLALAVSSPPRSPIVPSLSLVTTLLMFFNTGFAPADSYPTWLQPFVENQPMSPAIDTMRALATGEELGTDLMKTVLWAMLVAGLSIYPAIRGYRKSATRRG